MQHPSRFKTQLLRHDDFFAHNSPELVEVEFEVVAINGRAALSRAEI